MHGAGFCFARMTQFTCHLLISAVVVQLYFAQDIPCNVTEEPGGTCYSIPKLEGTDCTYSWSDSHERVLAHQEGHLKEVVNKNNTSLLTSECLSNIIYRRHCDLEGYEYTVNCSTTCIEKTVHQKKGVTPRIHWIVLIVPCVVVVVVLGYIGYILRQR